MSDEIIQISKSILAITFVVSSFGKLGSLSTFASAIQVHLGLRSRTVSRALATLTLASEVILAILLILPSQLPLRLGIAGATGLLLVFTAVMIRNAFRTSPLGCYCFGQDDQQGGRWRPLIRLGLLLLPLIALWFGWSDLSSNWPMGLEIVAAGILCALGTWFLAMPDMIARHRQDSIVAANTGVLDLSRAPLAPITLPRQAEE